MKRKASARKLAAEQECPCGGGAFAQCCGRFLYTDVGITPASGQIPDAALPATAEELMRSRYSAYVRRDEAYLRVTWHPSTCPSHPILDAQACQWLGLKIRHHASQDDAAEVEFVARYKIGGQAQRLHEISRFVRANGRWLYLNGRFP